MNGRLSKIRSVHTYGVGFMFLRVIVNTQCPKVNRYYNNYSSFFEGLAKCEKEKKQFLDTQFDFEPLGKGIICKKESF